MIQTIEMQGWIPYELKKADNQLLCYWLNTFKQPFTEPFFDETISKCRGRHRSHSSFSSVSAPRMILDWADGLDAVAPAAVIFHISRCGSTLISQMLAGVEENIVLTEVPVFDHILRLPFSERAYDKEQANKLLAAAIKLYGQKRTGPEKRLFIKADSWHIAFYDQIRAIFPQTPFILLYRRPDEVARSHRKQSGMHAVPGLMEPELFGIDTKEPWLIDRDTYLAQVLESYLSSYLEIAQNDKNVLLVNYNEGPMAILQKVAAITGSEFNDADVEKMAERSRYHSKRPGEVFNKEAETMAPAYLDKAMAVYQRLEEKRMIVL
jgi:hypothetical protein